MTTIGTATSAFYERSVMDMASLRREAEGLQEGLSRGTRLSRSSDDPVAASRLRQLARTDALSTIDTANADRASTDLSLTDQALGDFADYAIRAQELATQAASGTLTASQRASIATELAGLRGNMLQLANARDAAGHALFGGEAAGAAYTLDASGNAVYAGTATAGEVPLGEGQVVQRGLTGPEALGSGSTSLLAVMKTLADALNGGAADPQAAARSALTDLGTAVDTLATAQTVVGSRLAWIDITTERRVNQGELRANEQSEVGSTDIASTVARLQQTMTVLEASQASFTKLSGLSLFSMIR